MGILGIALVAEHVGFFGAVFTAKKLCNQIAGRGHSLISQPGGVRSHIGNKTGRVSADGNAFIQLLGHHHGTAGGKVQLMGSFLLQGTGGKRRQCTAGNRFAERRFHFVSGLLQIVFHCQRFLSVMHFQLHTVFLNGFCFKQRRLSLFTQLCFDRPEFFGHKIRNGLIPVGDDLHRHRLNAAGA